jgi:hypothetical protein
MLPALEHRLCQIAPVDWGGAFGVRPSPFLRVPCSAMRLRAGRSGPDAVPPGRMTARLAEARRLLVARLRQRRIVRAPGFTQRAGCRRRAWRRAASRKRRDPENPGSLRPVPSGLRDGGRGAARPRELDDAGPYPREQGGKRRPNATGVCAARAPAFQCGSRSRPGPRRVGRARPRTRRSERTRSRSWDHGSRRSGSRTPDTAARVWFSNA